MIYLILALSAVMRLLHLANGLHFIISPDSYYFHHLAERIATGESVPFRESGIAYLVAWTSNVTLGSILIPMLLGVLSTSLLYLVVKRMWSKRVALASAFCFAIAIPAVFQQGAGALDRDCLHLLLIGACTFAVYFLYERPLVAGSLIVLSFGIMWFEWGQVTIPMVTVGTVALVFLIVDTIVFTHSWRKTIWPVGGILVALAMVIIWTVQASRFGDLGRGIAELAPLDGREFLAYLALIPAMIVGVLCIAKRKVLKRADLFLVCWLLVTLVLGLVSRRLWMFSVPAYCVLAGIGLSWVWKKRLVPKMALAALAALMVGFSGYYAWHLDMGDPRTCATQEFQEAMEWIQENTPEGKRVLAWWDWGYMIEDLAERPTYMNNGSHARGRMEITWIALQTDGGGDWAVEDALRKSRAVYLLVYQGYPPPISEDSFCNRVFAKCDCAIGPSLVRAYRSEHIALIRLA